MQLPCFCLIVKNGGIYCSRKVYSSFEVEKMIKRERSLALNHLAMTLHLLHDLFKISVHENTLVEDGNHVDQLCQWWRSDSADQIKT